MPSSSDDPLRVDGFAGRANVGAWDRELARNIKRSGFTVGCADEGVSLSVVVNNETRCRPLQVNDGRESTFRVNTLIEACACSRSFKRGEHSVGGAQKTVARVVRIKGVSCDPREIVDAVGGGAAR